MDFSVFFVPFEMPMLTLLPSLNQDFHEFSCSILKLEILGNTSALTFVLRPTKVAEATNLSIEEIS